MEDRNITRPDLVGVSKIEDKISLAKRIRSIFRKHKKLIRKYIDIVPFNEPCLLLMRKSRKIEFFENATHGVFEFKHSDGGIRSIVLTPTFLHDMDYGRGTFKCYVCHEDFTTPLPEDPIITAELFDISLKKTQFDIELEKKRRDRTSDKSNMIWTIAKALLLFFGGILVVFIVANLFGYDLLGALKASSPPVEPIVQQVISPDNVAVLG